MAGKKRSAHYVNNKEFTAAVFEYVELLKEARKKKNPEPRVPNYIGESFWKICEHLSRKPNFIRYSFREEMVGDAIENCLKAIDNYDIEASTRSGNPNAHAYFSQVAYWAMVRRIQKEEKESKGRLKLITQSGLDTFIADGDHETQQAAHHFIESLKTTSSRHEQTKSTGKSHYGWSSPAANKKNREAAAEKKAGLEEFASEEE